MEQQTSHDCVCDKNIPDPLVDLLCIMDKSKSSQSLAGRTKFLSYQFFFCRSRGV